VNGATLCDEPGGPLWNGLPNWGVWALKAGEGCIDGDVILERVDDAARE
jgi:hypothetical protein